MPDLSLLFYRLAAVIISITIHEFFHAWVAFELGDPTAKYMGRISLNPVVHFDPMGLMMILFMSLGGRGLGWGKPVPVNPNNLRNGPIVGGAMVSAAGPLSNLFVAALAAIPLRLMINNVVPSSALPEGVVTFILMLFYTSIGLAVFNLLPIFPLDGYAFWLGVLHELPFGVTRQLWMALSSEKLRIYGPMVMLILVFWGQGILWQIMSPPLRFFSLVFLGTPAIY